MVFTTSPKRRLGVQASFRLGRLLRHARRSYGVALRAKASGGRHTEGKAVARAGKRLKKTRRRLARAGEKEQSGRTREIACLYSHAGRRIASAREGRESGGKREERGGGREQGEPGIRRRAAGIQLAVRPSADSAPAVRPSASALAVPLCSGRPPVCGLKPEPDLLRPSPLPPIDAADRLPRHHPLLLLHASPSSAAAPEPDLRSARLPIEASTCRLTPPSIRGCFLPLLCLSANALPSRQPEVCLPPPSLLFVHATCCWLLAMC